MITVEQVPIENAVNGGLVLKHQICIIAVQLLLDTNLPRIYVWLSFYHELILVYMIMGIVG